MAASMLVPDGSLEAFDNTIEDYRRYALHYPDYHAAYEGLDPRTLRRDRQAVRQVLLRWKDYDARRMQRDEDVEEELTIALSIFATILTLDLGTTEKTLR